MKVGRTRRRLAIALLLTLSPLAACATSSKPPPWQLEILQPDRRRLAALWDAWTRALATADKAGDTAALAALGPLVDPKAAVPGPLPGPGVYNCRSIRIGVRTDDLMPDAPRGPAMLKAEPSLCTISKRGKLLWFEQAEGTQRVGGHLFADDNRLDGQRLVFLGSMALPGEGGFMRYGADADRDQVGVIRPLGPGLWRLELPWPMWQSDLQVIEIRTQ
jgi:hypothetical protein